MPERDDEGLAGAMELTLVQSTALTTSLMGALIKKGVLAAEDLHEICDGLAESLESHLGPAGDDETETKKALRNHAASLRRIGAVGGPVSPT
jgi:hypothetical protein